MGIAFTPLFLFPIVYFFLYVLMARQIRRQISALFRWRGVIHINSGLQAPGTQNPCLAEKRTKPFSSPGDGRWPLSSIRVELHYWKENRELPRFLVFALSFSHNCNKSFQIFLLRNYPLS